MLPLGTFLALSCDSQVNEEIALGTSIKTTKKNTCYACSLMLKLIRPVNLHCLSDYQHHMHGQLSGFLYPDPNQAWMPLAGGLPWNWFEVVSQRWVQCSSGRFVCLETQSSSRPFLRTAGRPQQPFYISDECVELKYWKWLIHTQNKYANLCLSWCLCKWAQCICVQKVETFSSRTIGQMDTVAVPVSER